MKKTIYSRFDKDTIHGLPLAVFRGRIIVVTTEETAENAVGRLLSSDILGVDTETRPIFKRGESHKVALLQASTRDTCFLFRLNVLGLCAPVRRLLENTRVPMIGLSWHDDLHMLHQRGDFKEGNFIDLQNMVGDIGIEDFAMQKIWANLFGERLSKRQRLTNWEADVLTEKQKQYAALDAWACIRIYEEIVRLKETHDYELIETESLTADSESAETAATSESEEI